MNSMPIDLVLVRYGQSEGNLAQERSSNENNRDQKREFKKRHSSQYRLTDYGGQKAKITGKYIKKEFGIFDRYYVSEYVRARETAGLLGLNGEWYVDFFLREQDMGILGSKSIANTCLRVEY